ncbi:Helicase associated domain protein [Streptomyces sp. NPDC007818]|uniref:DEAD/DEAH box helicase n=1 Tax=Streptomyces sp. NPDC007818 TaxID=3364780 RepID=UPI00368802C1
MTPALLRLRPHQTEAADAALAAFAFGERRATVVSACGTGKTLTAAHIADQTARDGHVLVVVPTLELLAQTIQRWREAGRGGRAIGVSSMRQTTSGLSGEQAVMTTAPDAAAQLIGRARGPVTVFVTYGSLHRIRHLHEQHRIPAWDLVVVDEAHRATRRSDEGWGIVHDDAQIPAKLRLYMTATPRIFRTPAPASGLSSLFESMPDATMDRVDIFGPTVYRLGLADAIERKILADYRVVMPVIEDTDLRTILTAPPAGTSHHNGLRTAALHVAVLRAIADHDLRRVLVFHNRIAAAHAFARALPGTASQVTGDLTIPDLWSHAVDSTQKPWQRRSLLEDFDATSRRAVLSNVRVLNEGVDIPAIDAVVFAAARKSVIDAIQSIGRALRQQPGEGKKATLVIPVYLPDGASAHDVLAGTSFGGLWNILQALRAHDDTFLDRVAMPHSSGSTSRPTRKVHYHLPERALEIAHALGLEITLPPTGDWDQAYTSATAYYDTYGHLDVPAHYTGPDGFALGEWIGNQRTRHTIGRLSPEHRTALDTLGMLWLPPEDDFPRMLDHARAWAAQHGHLAPPHDATHGGHRVGRWIADCRRKAKAGTLAPTHEQALTDIDPWWNPPFPVTWRRFYAYAKAHVEQHGNGHVPNAYKTPDGVPLGQWISRQRNHFHTLHPAQAELLLAIHLGPYAESIYHGPRSTERDQEFREHLQAAVAYFTREGHLSVPARHVEILWSDHPVRLGAWIHKIRKDPRSLTEEQRQALERVHMVWDPQLGARRTPPPARTSTTPGWS